MDQIAVNFNAFIKVKLLPNGIVVMDNYYDQDSKYSCAPQPDKDGYRKFVLWQFMNIFGAEMINGSQFTEDNRFYITETQIS